MKINEAGLKLVKEFEGLYLHAYRDAVGVVTIGYGITNSDKDITGTTIKMGMTISKETAEKWLVESLNKKYAKKVEKYQDIYHFNENQYSALISFAFNIGSIDGLTNYGKRSISTIRQKILEYNKAGGRVLNGLTRRRKAELKLFDTPVKKKEPTGYTGTFPAMPPRGYFKLGDGITTYKDYPTQIMRVQMITAWVLGITIKTDGQYGKKTDEAVRKLQKKFGLPVNGCFGNLCLEKCKKYKK